MSFLETVRVRGKSFINTHLYISNTNRENQKMNKVVEKWDEILQIVKQNMICPTFL